MNFTESEGCEALAAGRDQGGCNCCHEFLSFAFRNEFLREAV